jgi:hypothetical protein
MPTVLMLRDIVEHSVIYFGVLVVCIRRFCSRKLDIIPLFAQILEYLKLSNVSLNYSLGGVHIVLTPIVFDEVCVKNMTRPIAIDLDTSRVITYQNMLLIKVNKHCDKV